MFFKTPIYEKGPTCDCTSTNNMHHDNLKIKQVGCSSNPTSKNIFEQ